VSLPTGVIATDDVESIFALDADCVFYTPVIMDVDTVCWLLRSGKNVVTTWLSSSPISVWWRLNCGVKSA